MSELEKQQQFTELVRKEYGSNRTYVTRQEMLSILEKYNLPRQSWIKDPEFHIARGKYRLPSIPTTEVKNTENVIVLPKPVEPQKDAGLIPEMEQTFVPFGAYEDVYTILKSRIFFPIFLTGPTRSGKTLIAIQACAELKRHLYRVNITIESDESDLIGGYKLIDGNTVWEDGPVIRAMEDDDGGVLLLDEIDLGSSKIMCLQPVFEGNGVFIKKINRWVYPKPGFTIISTANTKGRGSEDNKYIGTNVMNDALLERLSGATFEHGYPDKNIETKIIKNNLKRFGITDSTFPEPLCTWAEIIRKTYSEGGSDELITTSRLIHIVKSYSIYNRNRLKAIRLALARFDLNTQMSFLDAYTKVDADAKDDSDTNIKPDLPHHSTPSGMTRRPW